MAAVTTSGKVYRAAGADDAAFHYRYPVGAVLQQAASYRDYFVQAVVVAGQPGRIPRLSYRDRQYGYEFSSFNRKRGLPPIRLILVEEAGPAARAAIARPPSRTRCPARSAPPTSCPKRWTSFYRPRLVSPLTAPSDQRSLLTL